MSADGKIRCFGNGAGKEFYADYHDTEWGVPVYDDVKLFEMLTLEGAQAGLSWETILKKRQGYRNAFHNFNIAKVANMTDDELEKLIHNPNIIRNKLKIFSTRKNAKVVLKIQQEFGSFSKYLWNFVKNKQIIHNWNTTADIPTTTKESDALSKDLKKRGMSFVGSTIIYAFMQAVGMVNDHTKECWLYGKTH